jgi:thiol-disulfide isomerase/thioredoxin
MALSRVDRRIIAGKPNIQRIMKKALIVTIFIFFSGLIVSCKQMRGITMPAEQKHNIEANINGLGNDTIIVSYIPLSKMDGVTEPIHDIIHSNNGHFAYDTPIQEPIMLYIFSKKGEFIRRSGHPYRPDEKYIVVLLRPDDKLTIQGELKELFIDYQIKGSEFNEQYAQVRKGFIEENSKAVSLELELDSLPSNSANIELINELFKKRNDIYKISRTTILGYIRNNLNKELSAYYLSRQPLAILGEYYNELSVDVRNGLFKNALDNRYNTFRKFTKAKEAELKIKEGEIAPNFVLQSLSGDFSLADVKNRYIILDFWGSWCPPCIKGFPKMKEYYSKYKDRVEFIGIDCNEAEEKWRNAVQKYELPWTQVINASDINEDVSVMYGIQNFPTKIILDKDMRIVAKYIGETDEFYKKLDELMLTK